MSRPSDPQTWRCTNVLSFRCDGSWWLSVHGVINCLCCCPPSFAHLVARRGTAQDAPAIEPGRSSTPAKGGAS